MKAFFFFFTVLHFLSCNTQNQENQSLTTNNQMLQNDSTLVLLVDAKYAISHGWGHVYQCIVKEVLEGELEQDTIGVHVYVSTDWYQGLLKELTTYPDLIIGFEKTDRPYGPPPGFKDKEGIWWKIVSVKKQS